MVLFGPPVSSRDPKKSGGAADWRQESEQFRHWGLSSGSVLVPGSRGSSKGTGTAPQPKPRTPTSNWRGTVVTPKTRTERGAAAIFLIVELSTPYSGLLRLSPTPVLQAIDRLGR